MEHNATLYVDMDGVLADFIKASAKRYDLHLCEGMQMQTERELQVLRSMNDDYNFWAYMEQTPYCQYIMGIIKKLQVEWCIASRAETFMAMSAKLFWIEKELNFFYGDKNFKGVKFCPLRYSKSDFVNAAPCDMLIDDMQKEIDDWAGNYTFLINKDFNSYYLKMEIEKWQRGNKNEKN